MNPGIYLVYKEVGESSFDVVRGFKKEAAEAGCKSMAFGHGGTLDPFAEGLLLILAGQATRLMDLMHCLPKSYLAMVTWGTETDTCDHLGSIVSERSIPGAMPFDEVLASFIGWHDQIPPDTCAKKINGEPAYRKAHRGEVVTLNASRVYLHAAFWISHNLPYSSMLHITCKGGYYVRALARDLGRALGCNAHLSTLVRTSIGPWEAPVSGSRLLVQGEELIPWCRTRVLNDIEADHIRHGRQILLGDIGASCWTPPECFPSFGQPLRALHQGKLVALMRENGEALQAYANLRGGI